MTLSNTPGAIRSRRWRAKKKSGVSNKDKTHCLRGHEFTPENTRWYKNVRGNPARACRACLRLLQKIRRAAKPEVLCPHGFVFLNQCRPCFLARAREKQKKYDSKPEAREKRRIRARRYYRAKHPFPAPTPARDLKALRAAALEKAIANAAVANLVLPHRRVG